MADNNEEKILNDYPLMLKNDLKPFDIPVFCRFLRDLIKVYLID